MRFPLYILGFGFILSVAAVTAQTAPQAQTPPVNPTTPANQVGDGAQSKAGTPVAPSATSPSTTGGIAGSASASTTQNQDAQTSGEQSPNTQETGGVSAMTDGDLQTQIQGALSKEPTLTGDSPHVSVSGDTIELAGAVNTNKEKITASRIVQSYAGSKKLVNNLTISGGKPDTEKGTAPTASKPPQK
jgi:BON domain